MCSKTIGQKMKKKEPQGDSDELTDGLSALSLTEKENNIATVSMTHLWLKVGFGTFLVLFGTFFRFLLLFIINLKKKVEK